MFNKVLTSAAIAALVFAGTAATAEEVKPVQTTVSSGTLGGSDDDGFGVGVGSLTPAVGIAIGLGAVLIVAAVADNNDSAAATTVGN